MRGEGRGEAVVREMGCAAERWCFGGGKLSLCSACRAATSGRGTQNAEGGAARAGSAGTRCRMGRHEGS